MAGAIQRPLSPHLQIWKWGAHMLVSILHRTTGFILGSVGAITLIWWLMAASSGPEAYDVFTYYVLFGAETADIAGTIINWFFLLAAIVVSWSFIEHLFSGLRHLMLDTGAGYELQTNRIWANIVVAASLVATVALWVWLIVGRGVLGNG